MQSSSEVFGADGLVPPRLEENETTKRVQLVAPPSWLARVNEWRRQQPDLPNMSDAIRRLVDKALEAKE